MLKSGPYEKQKKYTEGAKDDFNFFSDFTYKT